MYDPDREPRYDAEAEAELLARAERPDLDDQRGAAYCLGDVKAPSIQTLRTLLRLCASDDERTALAARSSVAQIVDRYDPPPVDLLLHAAGSPSPVARQAAAHAFGNIQAFTDEQRDASATALTALLDDREAQAAACENIGFFRGHRDRFAPILVRLLNGEMSDDAREAAIQSLGNAWLDDPPPPPDVLAVVHDATTHANPRVVAIARWAVAALERGIVPPTAPADPPREASAAPSAAPLPQAEAELRARVEALREQTEELERRTRAARRPAVRARQAAVFGTPMLLGGVTGVVTGSILYGILAAVLVFVGVITMILRLNPAPPSHRPGTRAFEANHTVILLHRVLAERRAALIQAPETERGRRQREIAHLERQLAENREIVQSGDASPGRGYIGYDAYQGD